MSQTSLRHTFEHGMHLREHIAETPDGTVLWIHGLGESAFCFEGLLRAPKLAGWNHLAPDLPGYGKSPWPDEPFSIPRFAAHLADWLLKRHGATSCAMPLVLAGHSMGGVIGTLLIEELTRRQGIVPAGFLNIEGNISLADCGFSSRVAEAHPEDGTFETLVETLFREATVDAPSEKSDASALRVYYPSLRLCDERTYLLNGHELVELSRAEGLAPRLAELDVETLYIYGAPRGTGKRSQELLDAAKIERIEVLGAGHWPFLDQSDTFLNAAEAFLQRFTAGESGKNG